MSTDTLGKDPEPVEEPVIHSVHDPVVMAEDMREDLKNLEERARHYAEVVNI